MLGSVQQGIGDIGIIDAIEEAEGAIRGGFAVSSRADVARLCGELARVEGIWRGGPSTGGQAQALTGRRLRRQLPQRLCCRLSNAAS